MESAKNQGIGPIHTPTKQDFTRIPKPLIKKGKAQYIAKNALQKSETEAFTSKIPQPKVRMLRPIEKELQIKDSRSANKQKARENRLAPKAICDNIYKLFEEKMIGENNNQKNKYNENNAQYLLFFGKDIKIIINETMEEIYKNKKEAADNETYNEKFKEIFLRRVQGKFTAENLEKLTEIVNLVQLPELPNKKF